jgi:L-histidine Nalpha-methyltransferase
MSTHLPGGLTIDRRLPADFLASSLRSDALRGLTAEPKWLPPKWFYDQRGSELFEQITLLPEYYPTRAEREILTDRAGEIAAASGARTLIELGSGSSTKTRLLLDALRERGTLTRYVPIDVSESALAGSGTALLADYPGLVVQAIVGDFEHGLPEPADDGPRLVVFLGGTIGNLPPDERGRFLAGLRSGMGPRDALLLGTDLVKDRGTLVAAYDDAAGVTAEFNKNLLSVLNRELAADFDLAAFEHVALWDPAEEWIEMRLRSTAAQTVKVPGLDLAITFAQGEEMRTEISAKFRREGVEAELAAAGFALREWWTDSSGRFALSLSTPV